MRPRLAGLLATLLLLPAAAGAQLPVTATDTIHTGRFDGGKMWTFEYAPEEYFTDTYGFQADSAWFRRARLSALRIPGCSASFVSANGLMVTNHHCVRGVETRVQKNGEHLLDTGFYAPSLAGERQIPNYWADQLLAARDITDEVNRAVSAAPAGRRDAARKEAMQAIADSLVRRYHTGPDSVYVQLVDLYNGGRQSAYVFRRFTDVRMVFAVELQAGFFGGDPDNFTYPRYALDFAFLRVYGADGKPFHPGQHFGWSRKGVESGDVVFVIGNPGPTNRLTTTSQLVYQRDIYLPAVLSYYHSRLGAMQAFREAMPAAAEAYDIRNRMFGLSNSLKATEGRLAALQDPAIMARREAGERELRQRLGADSGLAQQYDGLFDQLAALQARRAAQVHPMNAFLGLGTASTLARATAARGWLEARAGGVSGDSLQSYAQRVLRVSQVPADLERRLLAARLADIARAYGPDDSLTRAALPDGSPEASAAALMAHSVLDDSTETAAALRDGSLSADDPALRLAALIAPPYEAYRAALHPLGQAEDSLAAELGRAKFAVYGKSVPPDGSFSPRIADGVVKGYPYNGTLAPPYTTFYGMYDRHLSQKGNPEWALPPRWETPPAGFPLGTPLNFASTADTYGGNSGSPAVTPALELVGLNFDRNIEGLSRDYIYLPERGRNVMVDVRAIWSSLDRVYHADRILYELETGKVAASQREAAKSRQGKD